MRRGTRRRRVCAAASRSSSMPTSTSSRRSPSSVRPGASGPAGCATATAPRTSGRSKLRFHTQTAGVSLTAQQPENNIVRTAIEALAAVLGGTQSLHTNAIDEVYALPTAKNAEIALRTQQVIAEETGVADIIDPLGGSWFVEEMTDRMEAHAEEHLRPHRPDGRRLDARRGAARYRRGLVPVGVGRLGLRVREGRVAPASESSLASTSTRVPTRRHSRSCGSQARSRKDSATSWCDCAASATPQLSRPGWTSSSRGRRRREPDAADHRSGSGPSNARRDRRRDEARVWRVP